jgi:hypothetical protein
MDDPALLRSGFLAIQELIKQDLILAGHDRSDGGMITALLEMAFAGNCGFRIDLAGDTTIFKSLFSEELGYLVECSEDRVEQICVLLKNSGIEVTRLGVSTEERQIRITLNGQQMLDESMGICGSGGRRPAISSSGCRSTRTVQTRRRKTAISAQARAIISASFPKHRRLSGSGRRPNPKSPFCAMKAPTRIGR